MRDQASSLRELKANYEKIVTKTKVETPFDFLNKIKSVSTINAYILVYPDNLQFSYPNIEEWLPKLASNPQKLIIWDQADLIQKKIISNKNIDSLPFPIMPKQYEMIDLINKRNSEICDFFRNFSNSLDKNKEIWVTIKSSELSYYTYLLNAAKTLFIMLPSCKDSIIKVYEIVKNIYNLKLTSSIELLEFSSNSSLVENFIATRIKNVAKDFLGIDLSIAGVVLSNNKYIPPINEGDRKNIKSLFDSSNGDFMYNFFENIVNLSLGSH